MNITLTITPQQIADLMITAIEGGIGYWAAEVEIRGPEGRRPYGEASSYADDQWVFHAVDCEGDEEAWAVPANLFAQRWAANPQHLDELLNENLDADSADVLVQLGLFGEIVYG